MIMIFAFLLCATFFIKSRLGDSLCWNKKYFSSTSKMKVPIVISKHTAHNYTTALASIHMEPVAISQIGKAIVATHYRNYFRVENVTLNKRTYTGRTYMSYGKMLQDTILFTSPTAREMFQHKKHTVSYGSVAAYFIYHDLNVQLHDIDMNEDNDANRYFADAYHLLSLHKHHLHLLVNMLMTEGCVQGSYIDLLIHGSEQDKYPLHECSF